MKLWHAINSVKQATLQSSNLSSLLSKNKRAFDSSSQPVKQIELDEIYVGQLLRQLKDEFVFNDESSGVTGCQASTLTLLYRHLATHHKPLYTHITQYWRQLLLKLYKYNKNPGSFQRLFLKQLNSLGFYESHDRDQDWVINRQLQQLLGLWINYNQTPDGRPVNPNQSKNQIIQQKERNYKALLLLVQSTIGLIEEETITSLFLSMNFGKMAEMVQTWNLEAQRG